MELVMYIFINKKLKMSAGKMCAQAGHAVVYSMMELSTPNDRDYWMWHFNQTKIVLEAKDENHIKEIKEALEGNGIKCQEVHDLGKTEVKEGALTALAVQIINKEEKGHLFKKYSLLK